MHHEQYMFRCLELARYGLGHTGLNPLVGAVVVHNNQIIGEGFHPFFGGPHAEVMAIHSVVDRGKLKNSTLYVNLEPCSHHGKTPPCADLILSCGIKHVVFGMVDPNPEVSGNGIRRLQTNSVNVTGPILQNQCLELNEIFLCHIQRRRPWIMLKWAQSQDGFMDTIRNGVMQGGVPISGPLARNWVHLWRGQTMGILIGVQTAINDEPKLSIRYASGKQPLRIVLDPHQRLPSSHPMRTDGLPLLLVSLGQSSQDSESQMYIAEPFDLEQILQQIYLRGIGSILVEGGLRTLNAFINAGLWDEARLFVSPNVLDHGLRAPTINGVHKQKQKLGDDQYLHFKNNLDA